jgi:uncharacterized membrane protein
MNKFIEKIPRSFAKVLSWRIIIIGQYFCIGYYTTGSIAFGAGLAGVTTVVNSCLYFFHERAWNRASWGKDAVAPAAE